MHPMFVCVCLLASVSQRGCTLTLKYGLLPSLLALKASREFRTYAHKINFIDKGVKIALKSRL